MQYMLVHVIDGDLVSAGGWDDDAQAALNAWLDQVKGQKVAVQGDRRHGPTCCAEPAAFTSLLAATRRPSHWCKRALSADFSRRASPTSGPSRFELLASAAERPLERSLGTGHLTGVGHQKGAVDVIDRARLLPVGRGVHGRQDKRGA